MHRLIRQALFIAAPALALLAGQVSARDLVLVQAGELPVILTAPHGGRADVPGCDLRTPVGTRFVTGSDFNTDVLVQEIAAEVKRLTGRQPYLVMAKFHRRFIDANRRPDEGYGSPGCQADYDFYHSAIRGFVDEVRGKYPRAMLFDVHGQSAYPDSIVRGTQHGRTVKTLLAHAGAPGLTGPDSVFGRFAAMGYAIVPANDTSPADRVEAPDYAGGYTVVSYGSHKSDGIDAMQLEFGRNLRERHALQKTARDTAAAIAAFYERHLKENPAFAVKPLLDVL
jgi:N-formylglutamate amidohydrolase